MEMDEQVKKRKEQNRLQREKIRAFDKEVESYTALIHSLIYGIMGVCAVMIMICPVQDDRDIILSGGLLALWAAYFRTSLYTRVNEGKKKEVLLYDKMKYLAIDRKQIIFVRIEYLLRFQSKLFLAALIAQLAGAYLSYGTVTWENVLWVLGMILLLPVGIVTADIVFATRAQ